MFIQTGVLLVTISISKGFACDCSGNDLGIGDGDASILGDSSLLNFRGSTRDSLEEILSPQLLQTYIALQLQKIAEDIASMTNTQDRAAAGEIPPCMSSNSQALLRSKRLAPLQDDRVLDVPVVAGIAEVQPRTLRTVTHEALKKKEDADVPVFKGTPDSAPVRLISPTPASARVVSTTVPVVKGSADPAHPTRPSPSSILGNGGLQLSPEEEQALAVLLEGRSRGPTRTPVSALSGKVGGKTEQQGVSRGRLPPQQHHLGRPVSVTGSGVLPPGVLPPGVLPPGALPPGVQAQALPQQPQAQAGRDCCTQKKLLAELERQLALLRRLNAEHLREDEWARANTLPGSYPSPYFPYLHNLPIHPARGMDDSTYYAFPGRPASVTGRAPAQAPATMYFLPMPGPMGMQGPQPQGVMVRPRGSTGWRALGLGVGLPTGPGLRAAAASPLDSSGSGCTDRPTARTAANTAAPAGRIDDKVKFSGQPKTGRDGERGSIAHADATIDAKLIGEPIDVEI